MAAIQLPKVPVEEWQPERVISPTPAFREPKDVSPFGDHHPGCRLVNCPAPSPTCGDEPDTAKLEFDDFRRRATVLTDEFFCSMDVEGMIASVDAMECQSFHDELVVVLLRKSFDRTEQETTAVLNLLSELVARGQVMAAQLARAFEKLVLGWDDLRLDVPGAPRELVRLLSPKIGLWDETFLHRLPEDFLRTLCKDLEPGSAQENLEARIEALADFKTELASRLESDLFCTRNVAAFATWLRQAGRPQFHHEVVLQACVGSFETSPSRAAFWTLCLDSPGLAAEKCGLVLEMLRALCTEGTEGEEPLLTDVDVQLGMSRLLRAYEQLDDEAKAATKEPLVGMMRGAVEKELLPAEFLKSARRMRFGGAWGVEVVRTVQRQTPLHSRRVWGTGDMRQFRMEVRDAIIEYFDSHSTEELARIVQELHLSKFETVRFLRKLLVTGMERKEPVVALDAVGALVGFLWTPEDVQAAFEELRDMGRDLILDLPSCREDTSALVRAAAGRGLLENSYVEFDGITTMV